jgi:hypothetical protein
MKSGAPSAQHHAEETETSSQQGERGRSGTDKEGIMMTGSSAVPLVTALLLLSPLYVSNQ